MSVNALRDIIKYQDFSLLCHNLADNGRYQMESTFRNLLPGRRREAQSAKKIHHSEAKMRKGRFFFPLSPIQSEDETRKLLFVHSRCHCTLCRAYLLIFAKSFLRTSSALEKSSLNVGNVLPGIGGYGGRGRNSE